MTATYTTWTYPGYTGTVGCETTAARTEELELAAKTALMLVAAPLIGLAFVVTLPVAGLVLAAWMAVKAGAPHWAATAPIVKRIALFVIAPFVGLAYLVAFPFVGLGAMAYYGVKAARK